MTENEGTKPKIIIDEDWKSQVQAEKAAAQQRKEESHQEQEGAAPEGGPLPPASFPFLLTSLATQAMAALGQMPDPIEKKPVVRLELAKHHIDTLGVLEEKTRGNLTAEEEKMLSQLLHDLRMAFVHVRQQSSS